jgi:hypothetical protein
MKDNWVKESATVAVKVALFFDPSRVTREHVVAQAEKDLSHAMLRASGTYLIESGEAKLLPPPSDGTWIPVSARLPEPMAVGGYVFVRITGYYYPVAARRLRNSRWETCDGRLFAASEVTHWMPLPAPPSDTK